MRENIGEYLIKIIDREHLKTEFGWRPEAAERIKEAVIDYVASDGDEEAEPKKKWKN